MIDGETIQLTELTEDCIEKIANAVAKKLRNASKPTLESQETVNDTVERRLRDLCE